MFVLVGIESLSGTLFPEFFLGILWTASVGVNVDESFEAMLFLLSSILCICDLFVFKLYHNSAFILFNVVCDVDVYLWPNYF